MVWPSLFSHSLFTSCLISSTTALHAEHLSALNVVLTFFLAASVPPRHSTLSVTTTAAAHHARCRAISWTGKCHATLAEVHSKTKLIFGVFLNRPVPHLWAASRKGDTRES